MEKVSRISVVKARSFYSDQLPDSVLTWEHNPLDNSLYVRLEEYNMQRNKTYRYVKDCIFAQTLEDSRFIDVNSIEQKLSRANMRTMPIAFVMMACVERIEPVLNCIAMITHSQSSKLRHMRIHMRFSDELQSIDKSWPLAYIHMLHLIDVQKKEGITEYVLPTDIKSLELSAKLTGYEDKGF